MTTAAGVALGLLAVLLLALVVGGGRPAPVAPGLSDAGAVTGWGAPVVRLLARLAALGAVGALLFAAVLAPGCGRTLPAASLRAVRAASWWALAWALAAAVSGLLTLSGLVGVPVTALAPSAVLVFVTDLAPGRSAVLVAGLAGLVAVAARRCRSTSAAAALLVPAVAAVVLPAVLTGHSATAEDHALAVSSLSVHVVSAALWTGGLLALVLHARGPALLVPATARFSALALVCFVATGASGVLSAWTVLGGGAGALTAALGTGHGRLLAAKTAALVALGALGWWHRRRTLPRLRCGDPRAFRRFAAVEAGVMLATVAVAVALSVSPPPAAPLGERSSAAADQDLSSDGAPGAAPAAAAPLPAGSASQDMSGHDHGELSVGVLIDETRFHVAAPVAAGAPVTVYNESTTEVTITASDGSFDVVVPGQTFVIVLAPEAPGRYPFSSRHSAAFADVLVVR